MLRVSSKSAPFGAVVLCYFPVHRQSSIIRSIHIRSLAFSHHEQTLLSSVSQRFSLLTKSNSERNFSVMQPNQIKFSRLLQLAPADEKDLAVEVHVGTQSLTLHPPRGHDASHPIVAADDPKRELTVYIGGELINVKAVDLYRMIRKMDAEQILSLAGHSADLLDETHLALSLKCLYRLLKLKKHHVTGHLLLSDHRFQILCAMLARKARRLEPSVLADMITFLDRFSLPSTHPAMQVCLQLAMKHINNLALDQLATLSHLVIHMTTTAQTQMLIEAIKVLCGMRGDQLSVLSVDHKICLLEAFGCNLDYVDQLLKQLWRDRFDIHKWQQAIAFLTSLGKMYSTANVAGKSLKMPERHWQLERWCLEVLHRQLVWLDVNTIKEFLVACQQLHLYNDELLRKIGQRAIEELFGIEDQLSIWSLLADIGHFHSNLSKAILESAMNVDCSALSAESNISLLTLIAETVCHHLDVSDDLGDDCYGEHTEQFEWDGLKILDNKFLETQLNDALVKLNSNVEYLMSAVPLGNLIDTCVCINAVHRQPPQHLVNYVIQNMESIYSTESSSLAGISKELTLADRFQLLILQLHATSATERIVQKPLRRPSILTAMLKMTGFDVTNGYWTSSGLYADHLVYNRSSKLPSTAVLCWYHGQHFWRNTNRLRCVPLMYVRTLRRTNGLNILVVNANVWMKLDDRERLDYLTAALTRHLQPIVVI